MEIFSIVVNSVMIVALLLSIVFTAGVVWRVEMRLDVAYKFFLTGIICFLLAEIANFCYVPGTGEIVALVADTLRALFTIFFLAGILSMRRIVREMDGERGKNGGK